MTAHFPPDANVEYDSYIHTHALYYLTPSISSFVSFQEIERSKLETDMRDAADEAREEVIEIITNIKDQSTVVQSIPHSTE